MPTMTHVQHDLLGLSPARVKRNNDLASNSWKRFLSAKTWPRFASPTASPVSRMILQQPNNASQDSPFFNTRSDLPRKHGMHHAFCTSKRAKRKSLRAPSGSVALAGAKCGGWALDPRMRVENLRTQDGEVGYAYINMYIVKLNVKV